MDGYWGAEVFSQLKRGVEDDGIFAAFAFLQGMTPDGEESFAQKAI